MEDKYLLIRWEDGRQGGVKPADFADPEKADNFKGARVISWEDGSEYDGPTTAEGAARRAEREAAAEDEAADSDAAKTRTPERSARARADEGKD